jgi:hypothetical protein
MNWLKARLFNPDHPQHYGAVLTLAWLLSSFSVWGSVAFNMRLPDFWGDWLIGGWVIGAHLYALRALLPLRKTRSFKPNMMAALMTLSYLPAMILCLYFAHWAQIFILPLSGAMLALFSFGIVFPGLSPFLVYGLNTRFVRPAQSRMHLAFAAVLFILAWVVAGFTAAVMASV